MTFVPFIDITRQFADRAPLVKGGIRAYYATGSPDIMETAAQVAAAKAAGMGVVLIDQTVNLVLFRAGLADVGDIEAFAGTDAEAALAVAERQLHHYQSTLYVSFSALPGLKAEIRNPAGVLYGVADYSWSQAQSEQLLGEHPDWAYTQYGDPMSNPLTLVPGTNVTLRQAQADIDIAKSTWANQFMPRPPAPSPGPYLHLADGTRSLEQIAAERNTTEAHLLATSELWYQGYLQKAPLVKNTPYATSLP
jgi:hypothetical protein